jgi:hypothetical protein
MVTPLILALLLQERQKEERRRSEAIRVRMVGSLKALESS